MLDDATAAPPGSRGSRDAEFSAYVGARRAALLRTAYLMTGDLATADDVVQTTLAKLYLAWHRVSAQDAVHAYTRRILTNEVTSHWRRAWRRRELPVDQLPESPVEAAYDDGTSAALWELVGELAPRARAVVVLRYYEQLSEAEVAEVMGISIGTVKSQCSRALATLRARVPATLERTDPPAEPGEGGQ
jgi:RNA polymerase sigma-70 factor (sigma-E family)